MKWGEGESEHQNDDFQNGKKKKETEVVKEEMKNGQRDCDRVEFWGQ